MKCKGKPHEEPQTDYQRVRYKSQKSTIEKTKPADKQKHPRKIETKPRIQFKQQKSRKQDTIKKEQRRDTHKTNRKRGKNCRRGPTKLTSCRRGKGNPANHRPNYNE